MELCPKTMKHEVKMGFLGVSEFWGKKYKKWGNKGEEVVRR
jgi:hypothetical protein